MLPVEIILNTNFFNNFLLRNKKTGNLQEVAGLYLKIVKLFYNEF